MRRYGTRYEDGGDRLVRVVDRGGAEHAALAWRGGALAELAVDGAIVDGAVHDDALLGAAHAITAGGRALTAMSAIDWARPTEIPAIAAPAKLPPGAGGAILNALAVLAARAGVAALRYAGPYPTHALWRSLARSFHCAAAEADFTRDALARVARVAREPIAIDFLPAPHERLAIAGGVAELRDGVERATLHRTAYERGGSPARLVTAPDGTARAELWFGDAPYAHVATLAADGAVLDGPHPIPACTSDVVGRAFPPALRAALAELVADAVPAPLAAAAATAVASRALAWADLGARAAAATADGFAVHAALWDRLAPHGLARLALALAEALAPVVAAALVTEAGKGAVLASEP